MHAIPDTVGPDVIHVVPEFSDRVVRDGIPWTVELDSSVGDAPFLDFSTGQDVRWAILTMPNRTLDVLPVLALAFGLNQPLLLGLAPAVDITASVWVNAYKGNGLAIIGLADASHLRDSDVNLRGVDPFLHSWFG